MTSISSSRGLRSTTLRQRNGGTRSRSPSGHRRSGRPRSRSAMRSGRRPRAGSSRPRRACSSPTTMRGSGRRRSPRTSVGFSKRTARRERSRDPAGAVFHLLREDPVHLVGREDLREPAAEPHPGLVAEMTCVRIAVGVREVVSPHELRGASAEKRADHGVVVGAEGPAELDEGPPEKVPHAEPVAQVDLPEGVHVDATWVPEVLVGTLREIRPGPLPRAIGEGRRRPPANGRSHATASSTVVAQYPFVTIPTRNPIRVALRTPWTRTGLYRKGSPPSK